jgi:hypothetical protein
MFAEPRPQNMTPDQKKQVRQHLAQGKGPVEIAKALSVPAREVHAVAADIPESGSPRKQKRRRIAQLTALMQSADPATETKLVLSSLRLLCKLDGSLEPSAPTLYDEVWALVARIDDWQIPSKVKPPRAAKDEGERRRWRATLQKLKRLLTAADDHVAACAKIKPPPVGLVLVEGEAETDKLGRMAAIQLYAQEVGALALYIGATDPTASPGQRSERVGKMVQTLGSNHNNAEGSEWTDRVLDSMGKKKKTL